MVQYPADGPVFPGHAYQLAAYILATLDGAQRAGLAPADALDLDTVAELARDTVGAEQAERIARMYGGIAERELIHLANR